MGPVLYNQGPVAAFLEGAVEKTICEGIMCNDAQTTHDIDGEGPFRKKYERADLSVIYFHELHRALRSNLEAPAPGAAGIKTQLLGVVENDSEMNASSYYGLLRSARACVRDPNDSPPISHQSGSRGGMGLRAPAGWLHKHFQPNEPRPSGRRY